MFPIVFLSPVLTETFFPFPVLGWVLYKMLKMFSNKRTLLTGPIGSGKTTFLQYISRERIPKGPSGAPITYKIKDCIFDEVMDFSGDEAWLKEFDKEMGKYHYILFFYDIFEYVKDEKYRNDVNARIDFIHRHKTSSQKTLLIGTHTDKMSDNFKPAVEQYFAGKSYQSMLDNIVYVNTTKKESCEPILNALRLNL